MATMLKRKQKAMTRSAVSSGPIERVECSVRDEAVLVQEDAPRSPPTLPLSLYEGVKPRQALPGLR